MQVTQPKVLCLVDDDGVGVRYVNATLDDGRSQQHIIVVVYKSQDDTFQFSRFHLSMTNADTAIGYLSLDERF